MRTSTAASLALAAALFLPPSAADADNTSGVFGPVVNDGHRSAQYRAAWDADSYQFAQRVHYQHSIDGDLRWRAIVQTRKTADRDFDLDYVRGELLWQLGDIREGWRHGLRFDARIRSEGRPALVAVNWANEFDIGDRWRARVIAIASAELGDGRSRGLDFETRASVSFRWRRGISLGAELFSEYGRIDDIPSVSRQSHQAGPTMTLRVGDGWQVYGGALFGLTDVTPDTQIRFWTSRRF